MDLGGIALQKYELACVALLSAICILKPYSLTIFKHERLTVTHLSIAMEVYKAVSVVRVSNRRCNDDFVYSVVLGKLRFLISV